MDKGGDTLYDANVTYFKLIKVKLLEVQKGINRARNNVPVSDNITVCFCLQLIILIIK